MGNKRTHEQNIELNVRQMDAGVPWDKKTTIAGLREAEGRILSREDETSVALKAKNEEVMDKVSAIGVGNSRTVEDIERAKVAAVSGPKAILPAIAGYGAMVGTTALSVLAAPFTGGVTAYAAPVTVPAAGITASLGVSYLQEAALNYIAPEWNAKQNKRAQKYPVTAA